jgi:hypothetical protein
LLSSVWLFAEVNDSHMDTDTLFIIENDYLFLI